MPVQWELLLFSLLVALGMGCFAFVAVSEWKGILASIRLPGAITSLVALGIGGIISSFHLGHPERIFHILGNVKSGISQEFVLTGITGLVIVLYIVLLLWQEASAQARKNVAALGFILAAAVTFATGKIYVLGARPAWNSYLIPVLYLATAAALGVFAMYIWIVLKEPDASARQQVNKAAFYAQIGFAFMVVAYVIYLSVAPFPDPTRSPLRLLAGDLALLFWGAVVIIGLLVPMLLTRRQMKGQATGSPLTVPVAGLLCTLIGAATIRALMYLLGSSVHQFIVG